ncbi:MAG: hypothetical protein WEB33_04325 [Bacteroidota bacterium]
MRKFLLPVLLMILFSVTNGQLRNVPPHAEPSAYALQGPGDSQGKKSTLLAVGLSLVLPGAGEMYAGNVRTGTYLMAADGALWLTYAGFVLHGNWIMDDARTFASMKAHADFNGKDDRFDVDIGNFLSTEEYNETRLRNREYDEVYSGASYQWNWTQESDRRHYRNLRIKSDQIHQASEFVVGALVVNRIVSALLAWRSVKSANATNELRSGWRLDTELQRTGNVVHGLGLKVTASF